MAIAYPTYLPKPSRDSYSRQFGEEMKRTEMDDGNFRSRRRFKSQPIRYSINWKLTERQLSIFEAWVVYDLQYGTQEFELPLYADETITVRLTGEGPTKSRSENRWTVSAEVLEIRPGVALKRVTALPTWPSTLPFPENEDYQLTTNDLFIEGNIGGGTADTRSRFTFKEQQATAGWVLSHEERAVFWSFWKETLLDGMLPFLAPMMNGKGLAYVKSRFITNPAEMENGAAYKITATLASNFMPKLLKSEYDVLKSKGIC